ncbi:MAG: RidA family protein [Woeseia sp.]|nr:RidA family protein [Woeseia sp.]MBT8096770.1 RidA family protein [Woeseia sp.]NNE62126.1 RidA family protein [Woeseia sp.]NNL54052.1 RidA family protein [Woeseia sp.]
MDRRSFFEILGAASFAAGFSTAASAKPGGKIHRRLQELGIVLPEPAAAAAVYVPYRVSGRQVFIAGQIPPLDADIPTTGKLGFNLSVDEGYAAARLAGLRVLAQLQAACRGDLDRVVQCVQLRGFVNSADDFSAQSTVINGVSDLLRDVFGDAGLAARAALGTNSLPRNVAVEIESIFEIRE